MGARACAYAFLGDLVLLYPLYALLLSGAGLSTAEITSMLALWSLTAFALEVPSGVWADAVSRRVLLAGAPLLGGTAFLLWVVVPSTEAFAIGFVLWGAQGALQSGAFEALVYDELDRLGASARYAGLIGRTTAASTIGSGLAMGLAAPAFALGGFTAAGIASAAVCVAAALVGASLPEHGRGAGGPDDDDEVVTGRALLRDGVGELRRSPLLRRALLAAALVSAIWGSLDEYLPLLATEAAGLSPEGWALAAFGIYGAMALGGLLAGRAERLPARGIALVLVLAAAALAGGALLATPAGLLALAAAFAAFQAINVVLDARLQAAIEGRARATVTSLAGLTTEVLVLVVFALYALGSAFAGHAALFAAFAGVYVVIAVWFGRTSGTRSPEGSSDR